MSVTYNDYIIVCMKYKGIDTNVTQIQKRKWHSQFVLRMGAKQQNIQKTHLVLELLVEKQGANGFILMQVLDITFPLSMVGLYSWIFYLKAPWQ